MNDVVLTDQERRILAEMAAWVDDPWLARELVGCTPIGAGLPSERRHVRGVRSDTPGVAGLRLFFRRVRQWWLAMLLMAAGLIVAMRGAAISLRTTAVGILSMMAGALLWWRDRRARNGAAMAPG